MNTGTNSLPKWREQFADCAYFINWMIYENQSVMTFVNCLRELTSAGQIDFGYLPARFAAMCMQVYRNGKPFTFADCDFYDELQDKFGNYIFPVDNAF